MATRLYFTTSPSANESGQKWSKGKVNEDYYAAICPTHIPHEMPPSICLHILLKLDIISRNRKFQVKFNNYNSTNKFDLETFIKRRSTKV